MKRLFLLFGLLLAIATPNFAQTKTDTIRLDIKPIAGEASDWEVQYQFADSIKARIEIEWIAYNEMDSQRFKPDVNGFSPNEEGLYSHFIQDSGQLRIYYTYEQSSPCRLSLNTLVWNIRPNIRIFYSQDFLTATSLDASGCTALTGFDCRYNNQLTNLDVSNTSLTHLYCRNNQMKSLNISGCTTLEELDCSYNQLDSLDISHNTALTYLDCNVNKLASLDVSNCTALTKLECYFNQLTSLDVSNNTALTYLYCGANSLRDLDVSHNTALTYLNCYSNMLSSLDVSHNTALQELHCFRASFGRFSSLDVSHNTALTYLDCSDNGLTSLDLSNNTALETLECIWNDLTDLDLSNNTALRKLKCYGNQLEFLDISHNIALYELSCGYTYENGGSSYGNLLTNLDISNNTALTNLNCDKNYIPLSIVYNLYNSRTQWDYFSASNQSYSMLLPINQLLDLSSEKVLGSTVTDFELKDSYGNIVTSDVYTENNFIFQFHNPASYTLVLKNSVIEDVSFTFYISVVEELPDGYFGVQVAPNNSEWGSTTLTGYSPYKEGNKVTVIASPQKGYRFVNWTKQDGSVFNTDSVHTFAVTENLELTANFEKLPDGVANESQENDNLRVYVQDRTIYLSENRGLVQVYNMAGQCVYNGTATAIPVRQSGVYIVRVGARSHKVLVR